MSDRLRRLASRTAPNFSLAARASSVGVSTQPRKAVIVYTTTEKRMSKLCSVWIGGRRNDLGVAGGRKAEIFTF